MTISEILSIHGQNSDVCLVMAEDKGWNDFSPVVARIILDLQRVRACEDDCRTLYLRATVPRSSPHILAFLALVL